MTSILPRLRGSGIHRADDRIAELKVAIGELRDENVTLLNRQAAADDHFAALWNDVLVTNQALVVKEALRQEAEVAAAQMRMERDELAETITRIEARHAEVVRGLEAELAEAHRRLGIACQANAAADQTQEIDVDAVRRAITPVPLNQAPFATTDPGRVPPSWATPDPAA